MQCACTQPCSSTWQLLGFSNKLTLCPILDRFRSRTQNTTQKSISIVFCVSVIRHDSSLSKYRKQKQSPPWTCAIFSISRGDYFCLRYLPSDESWRIELTQETMEMDFCVVFCDADVKDDMKMAWHIHTWAQHAIFTSSLASASSI
jgi:hypothetical protein